MRRMANAMCAAALVWALAVAIRSAATLDIYFIDVEGGQSTLIVTPSHKSFLIDTGYAGNDGRDADRIVAAARVAGVTKIDYLMITHFHGDHAGRRRSREANPYHRIHRSRYDSSDGRELEADVRCVRAR